MPGQFLQSTLLFLEAVPVSHEGERHVAQESVLVCLGELEHLLEALSDVVLVVVVVVEPLSKLEEVAAEVVSLDLGDDRLGVVADDARELLDVARLGDVVGVLATDSSARKVLLEVADLKLLISVAAGSTSLTLAVLSISHRGILYGCVLLLLLLLLVSRDLVVCAVAVELGSLVEAGVPLHFVEAVNVDLGLLESSCGVEPLDTVKDAKDASLVDLFHELDLDPVSFVS